MKSHNTVSRSQRFFPPGNSLNYPSLGVRPTPPFKNPPVEVIDVHGAAPGANIIMEVICMERSGFSMQVLLGFASLHSELPSLLEVPNADGAAEQ